MKRLSVIIPAYNEAARVKQTLLSVDAYLDKQNYDYEILLVDNNSSDQTGAIASETAKSQVPKARVLTQHIQGKGAAVKLGVEEAEGEYVMFMDADNATPISEMHNFWPILDQGIEVVIGDRYLDAGHRAKQPLLRTILSRGSNLLIQAVLLPHIHDTQAGFKAFKGEAAKRIFRYVSIYDFAFDMELLALARKLKYRVKAVPISRKQSGGSTVPPTAFIKSLLDLFLIKWRIITNYYGIK